MKIIKERENLGSQVFSCETCGTEFIAERGEYTQIISEYEEIVGRKPGVWSFLTGTVLVKTTPCFYIVAKCPYCRTKMGRYVPTGEKPCVHDAVYWW